MMEALRNGAKTWVAKVLLGLVIAVFALLGVSSMDMNATLQGLFKQDLATVDGTVISSEAFQEDFKRTIQQIGQQTQTNLTIDEAREKGIHLQVRDRMISQASLDAQAQRLGLSISDEAVAAVVQSEPIFKGSNGQFDVDRFRALLQQNGLNEQSYLAIERSTQLREAVTGLASGNLTLPRTLAEALIRYREETRDARYVSFTVSETDVPQPSEDEIKKQYDATPAAYTAPEYRSIAVLKAEPADIAKRFKIEDQEIADAYDTYKEEYYEQERRDIIQVSFPDIAAAQKAKVRVDAGEDLIKIAGELGQTEKDITFSGKLKTDFLDDKIADAAFGLAEGAVSGPVQGSLNTALLKAVKISPARQPDLAELKERLRERLALAKAKDEMQAVYDAVEDARAQQVKFEDIAAKAEIPLLIVPAVSASGFDKYGQPVSLPDAQELLKAVFASDVGLDADAIPSGDGYVWFDVREVIPSAVRPLNEVRTQVVADWSAAKLRNLASDKAKAIVEKAGATTKLETIATELGGTIKTASGLRRNNTSEDFDGLATVALFSVPEKALTWSLEGDGKSARIIEVAKVTVPSSMAASGKDVTDVAKRAMGSDLLDAYMKSAKAGADVVLNEELWRKIGGQSTTQ